MGIGAGALRAGKAIIELGLSDGAVDKALAAVEHKMKRVGDVMSNIGKIGLGISAAVAAPFIASIKAASDASESINKFRAVFSDQADSAEDWARRTAKAVGRSKVEILDSLSAFQGFFKGLGFGGTEARNLSQQIQGLAIDFASFHNLTDAEAMERFISALSGSSEVLDRFGINTKQVALQQELLRQGIHKSWTAVTEQEKAVARLNIIMQAMTAQGAVGDAVKTAGSFANQMKALQARIHDTAVEIGTTLLPTATRWLAKLTEIATKVSEWVSNNNDAVESLAAVVVKVGLASAAIYALGAAINVTSKAIVALRIAITLLSGHPLIALAAAVAAVVVAFAHWMGWLDPLYEKLHKIMGLADKGAGQVDKLTAALEKQIAVEARQQELRDRIAGNRAATGNPWGIGPNANRTPPDANNPLGGAIEADDFASKAGEWFGEKLIGAGKALGDMRREVELTLHGLAGLAEQAPQLANLSVVSQQAVDRAPTSGGRSEAIFDTRLARQMFGAGSDEELAQLRKIEKNTRRGRGGLPVV